MSAKRTLGLAQPGGRRRIQPPAEAGDANHARAEYEREEDDEIENENDQRPYLDDTTADADGKHATDEDLASSLASLGTDEQEGGHSQHDSVADAFADIPGKAHGTPSPLPSSLSGESQHPRPSEAAFDGDTGLEYLSGDVYLDATDPQVPDEALPAKDDGEADAAVADKGPRDTDDGGHDKGDGDDDDGREEDGAAVGGSEEASLRQETPIVLAANVFDTKESIVAGWKAVAKAMEILHAAEKKLAEKRSVKPSKGYYMTNQRKPEFFALFQSLSDEQLVAMSALLNTKNASDVAEAIKAGKNKTLPPKHRPPENHTNHQISVIDMIKQYAAKESRTGKPPVSDLVSWVLHHHPTYKDGKVDTVRKAVVRACEADGIHLGVPRHKTVLPEHAKTRAIKCIEHMRWMIEHDPQDLCLLNFDEVPIFVLPNKKVTVAFCDRGATKPWCPTKSRVTVVVATVLLRTTRGGKQCIKCDILAPFMIFRGKQHVAQKTALTEIREASDSACQENGWMERSLMKKMFKHFVEQLGLPTYKIVWAYDNFGPHEWIEDHGHNVVPLPPGQTHISQPVDCGLGQKVQDAYCNAVKSVADKHDFDPKPFVQPHATKTRIIDAVHYVATRTPAEHWWRRAGIVKCEKPEQWVGCEHFSKKDANGKVTEVADLEKLVFPQQRDPLRDWNGGKDGSWHSRWHDCPDEYHAERAGIAAHASVRKAFDAAAMPDPADDPAVPGAAGDSVVDATLPVAGSESSSDSESSSSTGEPSDGGGPDFDPTKFTPELKQLFKDLGTSEAAQKVLWRNDVRTHEAARHAILHREDGLYLGHKRVDQLSRAREFRYLKSKLDERKDERTATKRRKKQEKERLARRAEKQASAPSKKQHQTQSKTTPQKAASQPSGGAADVIPNQGNSCFAAAALQLLFVRFPDVRAKLREKMVGRLVRVVKNHESVHEVFGPFVNGPEFHTHDARLGDPDEFLRKLSDAITDEQGDAWQRPFKAKIVRTRVYRACGCTPPSAVEWWSTIDCQAAGPAEAHRMSELALRPSTGDGAKCEVHTARGEQVTTERFILAHAPDHLLFMFSRHRGNDERHVHHEPLIADDIAFTTARGDKVEYSVTGFTAYPPPPLRHHIAVLLYKGQWQLLNDGNLGSGDGEYQKLVSDGHPDVYLLRYTKKQPKKASAK